ncbi:stage II sporulation protein M [Polaribacter vadi]|uniref:stage II sporulation protein M n=1 Tax=Polaribacter TaxID=52959 RepID=UPI001C082CA5|nr:MULTISPECIES: stage II sporulation protein M [Polaribacter]MBU3012363.1 stage II sporulation protein M [Polaribacter vadi]MDO6742180.1 stage II sporulation protein M [Polaribacter sp. 1_MG-2023]
MREVAFIKQNKEKWLEFEQGFQNKDKKSPDDIANLHIKIMNDLVYAQTYYPKSKVTVYLNKLAKSSFDHVYDSKRTNQNPFIYFFLDKVPLLCYQYRKYFYLSFIVFFVCFFVGLLSTFNDETFARQILGNNYVDLTIENIESGDAMAIYKGGSNWGTFIGIYDNNQRVGLYMFLSGIFLGIGTAFYVVKNAIMVAVFQAFFYQYNSLFDSLKGIWIHGTYEIFGIIIEAAAGYIIGASILFPGTLKRFESFKKGIRDAFYIFISTIPFTIIAAFLEGYVTRYSNKMPAVFCFLIIGFSLVSISYYYLILPFKVARKHSLR